MVCGLPERAKRHFTLPGYFKLKRSSYLPRYVLDCQLFTLVL